MDVMTFVPTLPMIRPPVDEHLRNFSRRAQRVCHENDRSNLIALTQLVLNSFLEDQIQGTRILDAIETNQISDFLIMLEKCIWHGFKAPSGASFVGRKREPEAEIWHFLGQASKTNPEMEELYKSVCEMSSLSKPLSKFRAFWRLAMMQKRLAAYFECLFESAIKENFYEDWALLRSENCAFLAGAFLALGVFDCNLFIDNDQLQEQINSFDLTPYLRMPTLPSHVRPVSDDPMENHQHQSTSSENNNASSNDAEQYTELSVILDQKCYLEEINKKLCTDLEQLKRKVEKSSTDNGSLNSNNSAADDRSLIFTERLKDLEKERDILRARLAEKEDNLRICQDQLEGTRRFTKDLYEKLRAADSKVKRLQRDNNDLKELHGQELTQLTNSLQSLQVDGSSPSTNGAELVENGGNETSSSPLNQLRQELVRKTAEYSKAMDALKQKHEELSNEREQLDTVRRRCAELDARIDALGHVEQELAKLKEEYKNSRQELAETRQALQEFSEELSESKLRMVELQEEIMPLSEAQWMRDSEVGQCQLCDVAFSVLHRRHHCRNCGKIFCNSCTSGRVKLPSSSNPVRVCLNCYHLLRNRHSTIASIIGRNHGSPSSSTVNSSCD